LAAPARQHRIGGEQQPRIIARRRQQRFETRHFGNPEARCTALAGAQDFATAAQLFVGFSLSDGRREKEAVIKSLKETGYVVHDMSDNEMAKLHVRYMVGGRVAGLQDELIYRFQFPERPGALLKFLDGLATEWNISLFHYRNHGADYGRVLAGIQVPEADRVEFRRRLDDLGYPCWDETGNPAYQCFLKGDVA